MKYLTGRTALVTGAARGIGLATAGRLAAKGAALALVDVDAAAVEAASRSIAGHVLSIRADALGRGGACASGPRPPRRSVRLVQYSPGLVGGAATAAAAPALRPSSIGPLCSLQRPDTVN